MENKICQNCKNNFAIEPDDFSFYEKIGVPPPTWCPECRFVRKIAFINERSLYKRACAECGISIIAMYHPDTPFPVWCMKCHIADTWDGCDYAKEYDFSRPFFEQFKELKYSTPHRALDQNERNSGGCEYSNLCYSSKDIYLSFDVVASENIKYSSHVLKGNKNCLDCRIVRENDRGYELVQSSSNYNSTFLVESEQCVESHFLYDCTNCVNCCLSSNLRNKSCVFKNQQLSKEAYKEAVADLHLDTYSGQTQAKEVFADIAQKAIHKYAHVKNSVNAIGDFIENSKNVYHCYGVESPENVKYAYLGGGVAKDSQDLIMTGRIEECYEFTLGGRGASRALFSLSCGGGCKNICYSDNCRGSSDCFGCVNLQKKQYCILNKQYTKEAYFEMIEKIKKHMTDMPYIDKLGRQYVFGDFFPTEMSSFGYNETVAFEERPLTRDEALLKGYTWREMESKSYAPTIQAEAMPDGISEVLDTIVSEIIECPNQGKMETQCTSAFRILPDELAFYRQMNLPIPRYCPNCRYHSRLVWRNPFRFYKRQCMCAVASHSHDGGCSTAFETMYSPDRSEIIYCERCYQQEVL